MPCVTWFLPDGQLVACCQPATGPRPFLTLLLFFSLYLSLFLLPNVLAIDGSILRCETLPHWHSASTSGFSYDVRKQIRAWPLQVAVMAASLYAAVLQGGDFCIWNSYRGLVFVKRDHRAPSPLPVTAESHPRHIRHWLSGYHSRRQLAGGQAQAFPHALLQLV